MNAGNVVRHLTTILSTRSLFYDFVIFHVLLSYVIPNGKPKWSPHHGRFVDVCSLI